MSKLNVQVNKGKVLRYQKAAVAPNQWHMEYTHAAGPQHHKKTVEFERTKRDFGCNYMYCMLLLLCCLVKLSANKSPASLYLCAWLRTCKHCCLLWFGR